MPELLTQTEFVEKMQSRLDAAISVYDDMLQLNPEEDYEDYYALGEELSAILTDISLDISTFRQRMREAGVHHSTIRTMDDLLDTARDVWDGHSRALTQLVALELKPAEYELIAGHMIDKLEVMHDKYYDKFGGRNQLPLF